MFVLSLLFRWVLWTFKKKCYAIRGSIFSIHFLSTCSHSSSCIGSNKNARARTCVSRVLMLFLSFSPSFFHSCYHRVDFVFVSYLLATNRTRIYRSLHKVKHYTHHNQHWIAYTFAVVIAAAHMYHQWRKLFESCIVWTLFMCIVSIGRVYVGRHSCCRILWISSASPWQGDRARSREKKRKRKPYGHSKCSPIFSQYEFCFYHCVTTKINSHINDCIA